MLFLTPVLHPDTEAIMRSDLAALASFDGSRTASQMENIWTNVGKVNATANIVCSNAVDRDGEWYHDLQVQITARFIKGDRRYFVGAGFAIDLDALLTMLKDMDELKLSILGA